MSGRGWEIVGEGGREWESGRVRVRKPLRTAKEPALVKVNFHLELLLPLPTSLRPPRKTCQERKKSVRGSRANVVWWRRRWRSQKTISTVGEEMAWP